MPEIRSKKFIFFVLSILVILLIIILTYLVLFRLQDSSEIPSDTKSFTKETTELAHKYASHFNQDQVQEALNKINDPALPENVRYGALANLSFYHAVAYSNGHEPEIREYGEIIDGFAKENYDKFYDENSFAIPCADPACGEKPDEEMKTIQKIIKESGMSETSIDSVNKNLYTAIYIPADRLDEKLYGLGLVIEQLEFENNGQASSAASLLKKYVKDKYSFEYTSPEEKNLILKQ